MGFQLVDYPGKPNLWPQTFTLEKPEEDGHSHKIALDPAHTLGEDILGNTWRWCEACSQYHLPMQPCYELTQLPGVVNIPTPFASDPLPTSEPWTITTCEANDVSGSVVSNAGLTIGPQKIPREVIEDSLLFAIRRGASELSE